MRRFRYLLVIVILVVACGTSGDVKGSLEDAEERWAAAGIVDYDLEVGYGCFCVPERTGPFEVTVRAGEIVEIQFEGAVIQPEPGLTPVEVFTVEGLFEAIRSNLDADEISVTYGELGNPTLIEIDSILEAVDDELTITAVLATR